MPSAAAASAQPLAQLHCPPLEGQAPTTAAQIAQHLAQAPGWSEHDGAIERNFRFANFHHTMFFVNAVAWIAHDQDHHPNMQVSYNCCLVRFNTHSVGGISINDFICAAKVNALLPASP